MVDLTRHPDPKDPEKMVVRARLLDLVPGRSGTVYKQWLLAETIRRQLELWHQQQRLGTHVHGAWRGSLGSGYYGSGYGAIQRVWLCGNEQRPGSPSGHRGPQRQGSGRPELDGQ